MFPWVAVQHSSVSLDFLSLTACAESKPILILFTLSLCTKVLFSVIIQPGKNLSNCHRRMQNFEPLTNTPFLHYIYYLVTKHWLLATSITVNVFPCKIKNWGASPCLYTTRCFHKEHVKTCGLVWWSKPSFKKIPSDIFCWFFECDRKRFKWHTQWARWH